jgi:hypothetical protein
MLSGSVATKSAPFPSAYRLGRAPGARRQKGRITVGDVPYRPVADQGWVGSAEYRDLVAQDEELDLGTTLRGREVSAS